MTSADFPRSPPGDIFAQVSLNLFLAARLCLVLQKKTDCLTSETRVARHGGCDLLSQVDSIKRRYISSEAVEHPHTQTHKGRSVAEFLVKANRDHSTRGGRRVRCNKSIVNFDDFA